MWEDCQAQKKKNSRAYQRTLTYLFLQKIRCPKCNNLMGGKATKKKNGNIYYYYYCNNCKLNLKENVIEEYFANFINEIDDLKEKNSKLQTTINFFENLFDRLVKFIKDKMFGKEKEREDYWNFSKNLYTHGIFSDKTIESIKDDYIWNKENDKSKEKDDYEIEM